MLNPPDQANRERALDPFESFIVQAPAGSGKTALLISRLLSLLAHCDYPEQILAITFTRKAAQEMQARCLEALKQGMQPRPKDPYAASLWTMAQAVIQREQDKCWQLLQNPHRLRIMTIDAFCMQISQHMPITTELSHPLQMLNQSEPLYEQAIDQVILNASDKDPWYPALEKLLFHLNMNIPQLKRLLCTLLACRDQWLPYLVTQNAENLQTILQSSIESFITEQLAQALDCMDHEDRNTAESLLRFALDQDDCVLHTQLDALTAWHDFCGMTLTTQYQWRKTVTTQQGFPAPSSIKNKEEKAHAQSMKATMQAFLERHTTNDKLLDCLQMIARCPSTLYHEDEWSVLQALSTLLPIVAAQLSLCMQSRQQADFTEVSMKALQALTAFDNPQDIGRQLDQHIHHILVDEFQDTSIAQFRLLQQLTAGWQPGEHRTLFVVGDPMQSIYRFRQAEVSLFHTLKAHGMHHIKLQAITLKSNFRSDPMLIDWVNTQGNAIFTAKSDPILGQIPFSEATATRNENSPHTKACCHRFPEDPNAQAQAIVDLIQMERAQHPDQSIAILVRSRSHLEHIIPALKAAHIPLDAHEIQQLSSHSVTQDLLALTRALDHLADRTAWFAILRAPWCGLKLDDLLILSENHAQTTIWHQMNDPTVQARLTPNGRMRLQRILTPINNAIHERLRLPLHEMVERTWFDLSGPACYPSHDTRLVAEAFFNHLANFYQSHGSYDPHDHEMALTQLYAPNTESHQAVQVMTIHKAKGLEFDCVIIPECQRTSMHGANPLLLWQHHIKGHGKQRLFMAPLPNHKLEHSAYELLKYLHRNQSQNESKRLLYVALTRAKSRIHCTARLEDPDRIPAHSFADYLRKPFEEAPLSSLENPEVIEDETAPIGFSRLSDDWQSQRMIEPAQVDWDAGNRYVAQAISSIAVCGTVIHQLLAELSQRMPLPKATPKWLASQKAHWSKWLRLHGYPEKDDQHALSFIESAIGFTLSDPKGQWILSPHEAAKSEYAMVSTTAHGFENHVIDRTFIDQGTRWIIDYKCTPSDQPDQVFLAQQWQQHQAQLHRYAQLFTDESRPIMLGLYFPICQQWLAKPYAITSEVDHASSH